METKIDAVEKGSTEANGMTWDEKGINENSRSVPNENKAVATGFKEDSEEGDVVRMTGTKEVDNTIDSEQFRSHMPLWNSGTKKPETDA